MIRSAKLGWQILLLIGSFVMAGQVSATEVLRDTISIGVLAYNGKPQALTRWKPTADYLARHINSHSFMIQPLTHEEFIHAINKGQLDFILTNPGHYIGLEVKFGATRIATFRSRFRDEVLTQFGSVIFASANSDIFHLDDLKGHSMAAVSQQAFGGFQLAYRELFDYDIDAYKDLTLMWLGFPQTDIVKRVIEGKADVGTVRSGILENMVASGEIDLSQIRVLGSKDSNSFPLLLSTALYPEWPIARLPDTDSKLAKQVAITLLQMPENAPPAVASGGAGWTIPLDYLNVHELFRKLQIDPYPPVPLKVKEVWLAYRHWVFLMGFLFLFGIFIIFFTLRINRQLKQSERALSEHGDRLETTIEQRTAELSKTNRALHQDIESRMQFENTLHEGCESLQTMNRISSRHDLTREQRMQSIADLACQYFGQELALFSVYDGTGYILFASSPGQEILSAPLCDEYATQALEEGGIVRFENGEVWQSYVGCNIYISDQQTALLELATPLHASLDSIEPKTTLQSELGLQILQLLAQWIGNELILYNFENNADTRYQDAKSRFAEMTKRELQVLQLVSNGESNKSIARMLKISPKTVELHRSNLLRKARSSSSVQLIKLATQSRLVD